MTIKVKLITNLSIIEVQLIFVPSYRTKSSQKYATFNFLSLLYKLQSQLRCENWHLWYHLFSVVLIALIALCNFDSGKFFIIWVIHFWNKCVYSRSNTLSDLKPILLEKLPFFKSLVKEYFVLLSVLWHLHSQGNQWSTDVINSQLCSSVFPWDTEVEFFPYC